MTALFQGSELMPSLAVDVFEGIASTETTICKPLPDLDLGHIACIGQILHFFIGRVRVVYMRGKPFVEHLGRHKVEILAVERVYVLQWRFEPWALRCILFPSSSAKTMVSVH